MSATQANALADTIPPHEEKVAPILQKEVQTKRAALRAMRRGPQLKTSSRRSNRRVRKSRVFQQTCDAKLWVLVARVTRALPKPSILEPCLLLRQIRGVDFLQLRSSRCGRRRAGDEKVVLVKVAV